MGAITPVKYTTPDGIERSLRYTLGAARRIAEDFGSSNVQKLLNKYDFGCVPRLIYYCLFDSKGHPPDGMTADEFEQLFPGDVDTSRAALAAFISAVSQGKTEKNEIEARMREVMDAEGNPTGSPSGPSESSASDSPTSNSGTSPQPSLTLLPSVTATEYASTTIEQG